MTVARYTQRCGLATSTLPWDIARFPNEGDRPPAGACNFCPSQSFCPGMWTTIGFDFAAPSDKTTIRLHVGFGGAFFDRVTLDTHIAGSPFNVTIISTYESSIAIGTRGREGSTAAGNGLGGSTAGIAATFYMIPRNPLGLRQVRPNASFPVQQPPPPWRRVPADRRPRTAASDRRRTRRRSAGCKTTST